MKVCENGHPIDKEMVVLENGVQTCTCGYTFVFKSAIATFDKTWVDTNKVVFHHYLLHDPFLCPSCGKLIIGINAVCISQEQSNDNYEQGKHKYMPIGFTKN